MASSKTKKSPPAKTKVDKKGELKRHPLSEKYGPKMEDDELQGLAADIKAHGQHEPIITFEGKVLAGWTRYKACLLAGREPQTRNMDPGSNPAAVAFGTNFVRRKLTSVQKAFYGAQFAIDSNEKQTDIAKLMACNLNRLNQCCQLLKRDDAEAKKAITELRDNLEMGSAQFDEIMLELGIAREPVKRPAPARASTGGAGIEDDDDPLGGDVLDVDDLTGGQIDGLLDTDDDALNGDDASPTAAKKKTSGAEDAPLPAAKRSSVGSTVNPHETPVTRVAKAFRALSEAERRSFVKFSWVRLKPALDAAIGGADVVYEPPEVIKPDPSRIARNKPQKQLDDGHPIKKKPAPAKSSKASAAKKKAKGKHHDKDI